jgi:hypothetical protein
MGHLICNAPNKPLILQHNVKISKHWLTVNLKDQS